MAAEPSTDLCPPHGLFLLARRDDTVIGCAGLRLLPAPDRRGHPPLRRPAGTPPRGGEAAAGRGGGRGPPARVRRLRLDTRSDLAEARQLYTTNGYQEVAPFNDGRVADHWYGKILS